MTFASQFKLSELVGRKVRSLREFNGIPEGSEGIVDEKYGREGKHQGVMVKWDNQNVRDGFGRDDRFDETQWLEVLS